MDFLKQLKRNSTSYEANKEYCFQSLKSSLKTVEGNAKNLQSQGLISYSKEDRFKKNKKPTVEETYQLKPEDNKLNLFVILMQNPSEQQKDLFVKCKQYLKVIGITFKKQASTENHYINIMGQILRLYQLYKGRLNRPEDLQEILNTNFEGFGKLSVDAQTFTQFREVLEEVSSNWLNFRNTQKFQANNYYQRSWIWSNDYLVRKPCETSDVSVFQQGEFQMKGLEKSDQNQESFNTNVTNKGNQQLWSLINSEDEDWIIDEEQALGKKSKQKESQMRKQEEQKVATLGTGAETAKHAEETLTLVNPDKTNFIKLFYNKFQPFLTKNEFWKISILEVMQKLSDESVTEEFLGDYLFTQMAQFSEESAFDMVIFLMENRAAIAAQYKKTLKETEFNSKKRAKERAYAQIATNIIISKSKKNQGKNEEDQMELTNHKMLVLLGMDEDEINMEQKLGLKKKQIGQKINLMDSGDEEDFKDCIDFVNMQQKDVGQKLGPRFTKKDTEDYLIYDCKPETKMEAIPEIDLVQIDQLEGHIQPAFSGIKRLNPLQSKVKEIALETDENMLICAPTGAGKTNVAMLSVLRELDKSYDHEAKKAGDFKVVYISPLKALATEVTEKFSAKLDYAGVKVREFTGDMGLTKQELSETHIIVATPEKWDVLTRKTDSITNLVKLIIIDEIHLLDEERGRVLECIIARTLMNIERKQSRIRLVGLSATLPNYMDVARFMQVKKGLFYFNEAYRPVPLFKKFIGVRKPKFQRKKEEFADQTYKGQKQQQTQKSQNVRKDVKSVMSEIVYDIVLENLAKNEQVLIFVHSRKDTVKTQQEIMNMAKLKNQLHHFQYGGQKPKDSIILSKDLRELIPFGLGCHNAGLARKDRKLVENGFLRGDLKVVCCTATLAWGVNLPAHAVIIKGTDVYEPGVGFKDLSILDVQQIFGRAGRPQFDSFGEATLVTKIERLNHFMGMMSNVKPIESHFESTLPEALNAEIALGNITNLTEAFEYIKRTFWYVRDSRNPMMNKDGNFEQLIIQRIEDTLNELNTLRLIRFDTMNFTVESTELGRIASHFYINCATMERFCTYLNFYDVMEDLVNVDMQGDIEDENLIQILAQASEFKNITVRDDEKDEIAKIQRDYTFLQSPSKDFLSMKANEQKPGGAQQGNRVQNQDKGTIDNVEKVVLLVQGFLSMAYYDQYSLVADTFYVVQNAARILRCIFEISLKKNLCYLSMTVLRWCRFMENCIRDDLTPVRMFCYENAVKGLFSMRKGADLKKNNHFVDEMVCKKIEQHMWKGDQLDPVFSNIQGMREEESIGDILRLTHNQAKVLKKALNHYPLIDAEYHIRPVAQTIVRITLQLIPRFIFSQQFHMPKENFWIIVERHGEILHSEDAQIFTKNLTDLGAGKRNPTEVQFFLPYTDNSMTYYIHIISDRWVKCDLEIPISFEGLDIHTDKMEYTNLHRVRPLPITTLNDPTLESLFTKIKYFNPLQTQIFHPLFHTNNNVLIGAPTGSGKTIMSELAIFRIFKNSPSQKVVYVAPYKALAKERLIDWGQRFGKIGKSVLELTGDYTPDLEALVGADVLITTPEKWDGVSRSWQSRSYVTHVGLVIFDEIHLLGQDRGAVIEVIVSRMNYMATKLNQKLRMVGLSTAMANGADVANWFGVPKNYMFNFRPNVRPVPVEIHFKGFPEKNYCPRMNTMNKPAYVDIKKFSPNEPVLIFVSSRRQTRLTALDLISLAANEGSRSPFLKIDQESLGSLLMQVKDSYLKQTLSFGVGMHHAGLVQSDRKMMEELFVSGKIQVLIATSTLAWGVNFPAQLVIIKGTEFFDPKQKQYVDMPITDILQMVGRAGRPQFSNKAYACVYVEKSKKNFYRRYLNDPFPIESSLHLQLADHLNAEIRAGTITSKQTCMDYLTWTYFFKRITRNPLYYDVEKNDKESIEQTLVSLIDKAIGELVESDCIACDDGFTIEAKFNGQIASNYYIRHVSIRMLAQKIKPGLSVYKLLKIMSECDEYDEVPMRHNEHLLNEALSNICPYKTDKSRMDDAHTKTLLLFQAYFSQLPLPVRDYITDTKLVLDNCIRFVQAMIDIATEKNYLDTVLTLTNIAQMISQGYWADESTLQNIPHFTPEIINKMKNDDEPIEHLCQVMELNKEKELFRNYMKTLKVKFSDEEWSDIDNCIKRIPDIEFDVKLHKFDSDAHKPDYQAGVSLLGDSEAFLTVNIKRNNSQYPLRVDMKRLQKLKDASYWIIVGNEKLNKIYSLKKTFFKKTLKRGFQIELPPTEEPSVQIHLVCDSYIGIDQVKTINLRNYKTPQVQVRLRDVQTPSN